MTPKRSVKLSPKHSWSHEDRLTLALFDCFYESNPRELANIFNTIHKPILRQEGFKNGIPVSSITAQLHEFRNGGPGSRVYQSVLVLSLDEIECIHREYLKLIEVTALRMKIWLVRKKDPREEQPRPRPPPAFKLYQYIREESIQTETTVTTWVPDSESDFEELYTPTKGTKKYNQTPRKDTQAAAEKFLPIMVTPKIKSSGSKAHRYFLYRAFEIDHGFSARRFLDTKARIPLPPRLRSNAFSREVRPHLERDTNYKSPFLSFAQNPKVAIDHAFKKSAAGTQMAFAIFRYDDIKEDAVRRFGPDSGPYLVPAVCDEHSLYDLPGGYTGAGEFLTWGSVECEPFAVLNAADTIMIRAILRTTNQIDKFAGERLKKYLPPMNNKHLELFLFQLVRGFTTKGHLQARKSSAYSKFISGAIESHDTSRNNTPILTESDIDGGDDDFVMVDDDSSESNNDINMANTPELTRESSPNWWRSDTSSGSDYDDNYDMDL